MGFDWVAAAEGRPIFERKERKWVSVSHRRRCPICGKDSWCGFTTDGELVHCMRIAEGSVAQIEMDHGTAYRHVLSVEEGRSPSCRTSPPLLEDEPPPAPAPAHDYEALMAHWATHTPRESIERFACELGVSAESLIRLDVRYVPRHSVDLGDRAVPRQDCWGFPMHDDRRSILGIRLRAPDGGKFALDGSHSGAFIPRGLDTKSLLMICEGPTDTAAALTLGFNAVGRPSCSGATNILCDYLQDTRRRDIVVMADADGPGRLGARRFVDRAVGVCRSAKIITASPHKDIRDWVAAGATADIVHYRIENAVYHRRTIGGLD